MGLEAGSLGVCQGDEAQEQLGWEVEGEPNNDSGAGEEAPGNGPTWCLTHARQAISLCRVQGGRV